MLNPCLNFILSNESKNTEVNSVFINYSLFLVYRYLLVTHINDYCGTLIFRVYYSILVALRRVITEEDENSFYFYSLSTVVSGKIAFFHHFPPISVCFISIYFSLCDFEFSGLVWGKTRPSEP